MRISTNPYKEELLARRAISKIIETGISKGNQISRTLLIHQISLQYSVSIRMIETFINRFYVGTGELVVNDDDQDLLKKGGEDNG